MTPDQALDLFEAYTAAFSHHRAGLAGDGERIGSVDVWVRVLADVDVQLGGRAFERLMLSGTPPTPWEVRARVVDEWRAAPPAFNEAGVDVGRLLARAATGGASALVATARLVAAGVPASLVDVVVSSLGGDVVDRVLDGDSYARHEVRQVYDAQRARVRDDVVADLSWVTPAAVGVLVEARSAVELEVDRFDREVAVFAADTERFYDHGSNTVNGPRLNRERLLGLIAAAEPGAPAREQPRELVAALSLVTRTVD